MNLLLLAPDRVDPSAVRDIIGEDFDSARVRVVSPALNESRVAFWMSDADEAIDDARDAGAETVSELWDKGVQATGTVGESEPLLALQDALATFPADRILIFVRDDADDQRYRESDVVGEAERRFDVPVTLVRL
jgi:4-hydroxyphenylpyruvate dioxygenase-like putative hemolysin